MSLLCSLERFCQQALVAEAVSFSDGLMQAGWALLSELAVIGVSPSAYTCGLDYFASDYSGKLQG